MDVVMEGGDGYEACRAITSDRETGKIPVIFVTSKAKKPTAYGPNYKAGAD